MIFGIRQGYHDFAGRFRVIQVMVVTVEDQGLRRVGGITRLKRRHSI
jgi:hypothetical protein